MKTNELRDLADYLCRRRLMAEGSDIITRTEYSPFLGLDLCILPGCVYFRCSLNIINSPAFIWNLAALLSSPLRLGFIDWDIKVEVYAPTFKIPIAFPEEWEGGDRRYFWAKITTKSRLQFTRYRGE